MKIGRINPCQFKTIVCQLFLIARQTLLLYPKLPLKFKKSKVRLNQPDFFYSGATHFSRIICYIMIDCKCVGKTTVTVNLALAWQRSGAKAGIFDADIYGPNVPIMLGIHRRQSSKGYMSIARQKSAPAYIQPLEQFG
ncbi:MAG: Mrp/NBP35 family ATP-binding protein [Chloroflexi bacterium]|nr:Mrp/NBP35 family ATP-binding protein [Chloroflexota bacterium]